MDRRRRHAGLGRPRRHAGLPLTLAIIGGQPERFVPLIELYRRAAAQAGHEGLPVAINTHAFVGDDQREFAPHYMA